MDPIICKESINHPFVPSSLYSCSFKFCPEREKKSPQRKTLLSLKIKRELFLSPLICNYYKNQKEEFKLYYLVHFSKK